MIYELIAAFYKNAKDSSPRYRVPIGLRSKSFLDEHGFVMDEESTPGYDDYHVEVSSETLLEMLPDGYDSFELKTVLDMGIKYSRIEIDALEMDVIDDEGNIPPRGLQINETFVYILGNGEFSDVIFTDGENSFTIPLMNLRIMFKAMTMFQVIESLRAFQEGHPWAFSELREYFKDVIIKEE